MVIMANKRIIEIHEDTYFELQKIKYEYDLKGVKKSYADLVEDWRQKAAKR